MKSKPKNPTKRDEEISFAGPCTCGVKFSGGNHSPWCDSLDPFYELKHGSGKPYEPDFEIITLPNFIDDDKL